MQCFLLISEKFTLPMLVASGAITSLLLRFCRNSLFQLLNNDFKTFCLNSIFLPYFFFLSFFIFFHFPLSQSSRRLKSFLNLAISLLMRLFQNGAC